MRIPLPRGNRRPRIEIIPLIDIVFFLLATFVMVSMSMVKNRGIFVDLASSETSERMGSQKEFMVVSVDKSGRYFIDKRPVTRPELSASLERVRRNANPSTVIVNADKDASHGQVVALLDLVRKSGVGQAVFAVEPEN